MSAHGRSTGAHGLEGLARPSALIFDLDGTLIESRGDIAAACNHALASVGRAPLPEETIGHFVGDGARLLVARALGRPAEVPEVAAALAEFHRFYEAHAAERTTLMPGARALLDLACGRFGLALATNKPRATTVLVLKALDLARYFSVVRAGGDAPLKPEPHMVLATLDALDVPAARAWMIGDSEQDVLAGRAAGCVTIGIRGGFQADARLTAAGPDRLIDSLETIVRGLSTQGAQGVGATTSFTG